MKCSLKDVDKATLEKAVNSLAKELGATVVKQVEDYYGKMHSVEFGLIGGQLRKGYGFNIVDGKVEIVGDEFAQALRMKEIEQKLAQEYNTVAWNDTLKSEGFNVSVKREKGKVFLHASGGGKGGF